MFESVSRDSHRPAAPVRDVDILVAPGWEFSRGNPPVSTSTPSTSAPALTTAELATWIESLARLDAAVEDSERIDQLSLLERVKAACAAAQARVTAAFAASQRAEQEAAGARPADVGKGIAAQVALARRDSRFSGNRHLGLAEALVHEMPNTLAALQRGDTSEWRATLVARETGCLSREDRRRVDAELADRLVDLGNRQVAAESRRLAHYLDPHGFVSRVRGAAEHRRVSIRPAPDTMALVTGFVPVAQGVAVHTALARTADTLRAQGDPRSRGQIMADEFVTRLTGQTSPDAVPVEVQLVMTDRTLLGDHPEPALLTGHGPIPATLARQLLADAGTRAWLRRLYTRPADHSLLTMDSRRRGFPGGLRDFLRSRDQICRTPWCDAPIRHIDHITAAQDDGDTSGPPTTAGEGTMAGVELATRGSCLERRLRVLVGAA